MTNTRCSASSSPATTIPTTPHPHQGIIDVDRGVQCEDRALLEGIEADFPLTPTAELHTRSDRMTLEYRRILAELADASTVRPLVNR